jgi:hypothetical protein
VKLFVIMVGGYPPGSHLEVHDVRFHVAERVEDTFATLKREWWGGEDRFHLDAFGALEWADGHDIVIADEPPAGASEARLFFVHLGGYDPSVFGELHREVFVAAKDARAAKSRALRLAKGWASPHRDAVAEVEAVTPVKDRRIHLVPNEEERPFRFEARYMPFPKEASA